MSDTDLSSINWESYQNLTYEDYRRRASDPSMNSYEMIGCPPCYREGRDAAILQDIVFKLEALRSSEKAILDIGPGCSPLAQLTVEHCQIKKHDLFMMDSEEMLNHLPDGNGITKLKGRFPENFHDFIDAYKEKIDAIICYSVIFSVYLDMNIFNFIDKALSLLRPGGEMLIGDIPNISKRNRFFSSGAGVEFHRKFFKTNTLPKVDKIGIHEQKMDDSVVLSILHRYRGFGFDTYVLPQAPDLAFSNRREDILIRRP